MSKFVKLIFWVSLCLGFDSTVFAKSIAKKVSSSLKYQLMSIQKRLQSERSAYGRESRYYRSDKSAYYLRSITIRLKPFVVFKIPGITKLKIVPRFDFRWRREPPIGWENYSE